MARSQFKWLWLHTPTYATYVVEAVGVPLLLAAGAATKNARSAVLVLQSLTPNAQSVFRVLAEFQIGHPDDQGNANYI
jgi:origin recognition complex subunit 2